MVEEKQTESTSLESFLRNHRDELNQEFRMAWLQNRKLNGQQFLQDFQSLANSFLSKSSISGVDIESGLRTIYQVLLRVHPGRSWNEKNASLLMAAVSTFPAMTGRHGTDFLSRIFNASFSMVERSLEPEKWWQLLSKLSFRDSHYAGEAPGRFFRIAASISYLAGMTHLRDSAISQLQNLDAEECQALFPRAEPQKLKLWLGRLLDDPWADQNISPLLIGGYQGFTDNPMIQAGQGFARPPVMVGVSATYNVPLVSDSNRFYLIFADRFGAQIVPVGDSVANSIAPDGRPEKLRASREVLDSAHTILKKSKLPMPARFQSHIIWKKTLFAVSEDSHFIWVVPIK